MAGQHEPRADPHFLVFCGRKWENLVGKQGITWEMTGIFQSPDPMTACLRGMQKSGMGTAFAVEGFAWGVDTVDKDRSPELGVDADPVTRLEKMQERLMGRIGELAEGVVTQRALNRGDDDE